MQKDTSQGPDTKETPQPGRQGALKEPEGPGKHPNPGGQGPHGSGEGRTGMQPGAGHPRGR